MSANATTARSGLPPFYRRRRFWRNTSPAILMVFAFFLGVFLFNAYGSDGSGLPTKGIPNKPLPPTPKTVKIGSKEMKSLHGLITRFVETAVARKNLAESYRLVGPALREGFTQKQWVAGNVTVVPYPVDKKTWLAFEKPDWSYARSVQFQVHVITPNRPLQVAQAGVYDFFVDVIKVKRHGHWRWLVNNWVPRWTPPIPNAGG